jgi:hypothetical protein
MSMPVALRDITELLAGPDAFAEAYLHRRTGEVLVVTDEDRELLDDERRGLPADVRRRAELVRSADSSPDWVPVPGRWEVSETRMVVRFCVTAADPTVRDELLAALRGGPYRRFRELVEERGLLAEWVRFRERWLEQFASEWLAAHGVPFQGGL